MTQSFAKALNKSKSPPPQISIAKPQPDPEPEKRGPARGGELPQTKLTEEDVGLIRMAAITREVLRDDLRKLSNASLAKRFNVHPRTIEKVLRGETWEEQLNQPAASQDC